MDDIFSDATVTDADFTRWTTSLIAEDVTMMKVSNSNNNIKRIG